MIAPTVIYISVKAAARNVVRECVTVHHCDFIESRLRDAFQGSVELFGSWWKGLTEQEFNRLAKSGTCEVVRAIGSQDLPVIHALSRFANESDEVPCATYKNVKALVADLVTKMHVRTKTAAVEKRLHAILRDRREERFTFMGWSIREGLVRAVIPPVEADPADEPFDIAEVDDGYMVNRAHVRRTAETPVRVSVYDLICAITRRPFEHALKEFSRLPGVKEASADYKFPGRGNMISPVTDARGAAMIVDGLPGSRDELFRTSVGPDLIRYLGGPAELQGGSVAPAQAPAFVVKEIEDGGSDPAELASIDASIVPSSAITEVDGGYMLNGVKIRKTAGPPVRISVYDVMCAITGHDSKNANTEFARICERHPHIRTVCANTKFPGYKQKPSPSTDARGLVMIMNLLPGRQAAQFRMKSADVLVRYLGGDQTAVSEIRTQLVEDVTTLNVVDVVQSNSTITEVDDGYMLNGMKIRKTAGHPVRISVYDVMCAITSHDSRNASIEFTRIADGHSEVLTRCKDFKFPGRGQRDTPVTDARGLVMIMNLLPGRQAAQFRMKSADVLVRYLGGDQTLVSEIQRNAAAQEALPADNIGRLFGDAVAEKSQTVLAAPTSPAVVIESATDFIDMRCAQNYFRLTDTSLWSNVHPCGRPDLVLSPQELAKYAVIKIGSNGECTGRQPTHELALKGSKLLDSVPTKCYTYVEQKARDIWKNMNQLFEGTHACKTTRDTELLLMKSQMEYNERVSLVQKLVAEAEGMSSNVELKLQMEKTKQTENEARKADAEARKAEETTKQTRIEVCRHALTTCQDKMSPEMLNTILSSVCKGL